MQPFFNYHVLSLQYLVDMIWFLIPYSLLIMLSFSTYITIFVSVCVPLSMLLIETVWNPHTQKNILALEKIQQRDARRVCGSRFSLHTSTWSKSLSDCCHELHWPSLSICRKYLSMTTIYDMLHHHISLEFSSFFTFSTSPTPFPYYVNVPPLIDIDIFFY